MTYDITYGFTQQPQLNAHCMFRNLSILPSPRSCSYLNMTTLRVKYQIKELIVTSLSKQCPWSTSGNITGHSRNCRLLPRNLVLLLFHVLSLVSCLRAMKQTRVEANCWGLLTSVVLTLPPIIAGAHTRSENGDFQSAGLVYPAVNRGRRVGPWKLSIKARRFS